MKHDKELLRRRFAKNLGTYDSLAEVQRAVAERLAGEIVACGGDLTVRRGVELGAGTGFLTRHLVRLFPGAEWLFNDLVPGSGGFLPQGDNIRFLPGDGEALTRTLPVDSYDLIASASTVQWFDDLPGFLGCAGGALRRGGLLALSTFGPENFREITMTTGRGLEYYSLRELEELFCGGGMQVVHAREWMVQRCYRSPMEVLRHLRLTGVNAVAEERWTHGRLRRFEEEYLRLFAADIPVDGGVTLTFHPMLMIGKKS